MKRKRLAIIILLTVVLLGGSGCMVHKDINQELIAYINGKYEDTFTFLDVTGGSLGSTEKNILVSCQRFPDEEILVQRYVDKDGKTQFCDNYMAFVFEEDVRETLQMALNAVYGSGKVFYHPVSMVLDPDVGPDTTVEEYLSSPASLLSAVLFVEGAGSAAERDLFLEQFRGELKSRGVCLNASLLYVDALSAVQDDTYEEYLWKDELANARCDFSLDREYEFLYANWR